MFSVLQGFFLNPSGILETQKRLIPRGEGWARSPHLEDLQAACAACGEVKHDDVTLINPQSQALESAWRPEHIQDFKT